MISKVTSKYQITIPKNIRKKLHIHINSSLEWIIQDHKILVKKAHSPILKHQGSIKIGKGIIEADIDKAKALYLQEKFQK